MNTSHYPSLELCNKLTEIGFPDTAMNYEQLKTNEEADFTIGYFAKSNAYNIYRCPSVMEMLDVMPNDLSDGIDNAISLIFGKHFDADTCYVCYQEEGSTKTESYFKGTLPNALAEMILWLQENKYITF